MKPFVGETKTAQKTSRCIKCNSVYYKGTKIVLSKKGPMHEWCQPNYGLTITKITTRDKEGPVNLVN